MLFQSALRRELARTFSATLFVLLIIVVTMMLIKTLNLANRGTVNPSEVSLVLGYTVLAYLPTLLTLSLFISMVYALSRMYRDSEMAVWFASGQGLLHFLAPLLRFCLPIVLIIALLALVGWPWANAQVQDLRERYQSRGDMDRLAAGYFQESSDGKRVFYIDADASDDKQAAIHQEAIPTQTRRLFVFARLPHSEAVVSAASGQLQTIDGARFVVLHNGHSTELRDDSTLTIASFAQYGLRIDGHRISPPVQQAQLADPQVLAAIPSRVISTPDLVRHANPRLLGELSWRLGMAFSAINFVLLALAAARVNPRSGRSGGVVVALLFFVLYYNLINFGQSWISHGKVAFVPLLLALHGGIFVLCMTWLWLRHQQWTLRGALARWRTAHTGEAA